MKRFSVRSRVAVAVVAVVALLGLSALSVVAISQHAHAEVYSATTYQGIRGQLKPMGQVVPGRLATHKAAASTTTPRIVPLRVPNGKSTAARSVAQGNLPAVKGAALGPVGKVLHNFDGVNAIQNDIASNTPLEPPDEGLAAGNNYVVNVVNVTVAIYQPSGAILAGPFALNPFLLESSSAFVFDPRAYFDSTTNTWFVLAVEQSATESHLDLAVNSSGNPLNSWTIYTLDTTDASGFQCPCFSDYTSFGIDQNNVYLSGNEFSIAGTAFNGAQIFAISKSQLVALGAANYVRFGSLSIAGMLAYHVQPAISIGSPNAEYFMNSLDPNSTFDNRLGVWAMTNTASVTANSGMPLLSSTVITSEAYGFPVNAQTPAGYNSFEGVATTGVVASDFDAMQEVEYINGHLVGALNTAITISGDTGTRDGIAWFQVVPVVSAHGVIRPTTHVSGQGYLAVAGSYLLYPHIVQAADGTDAVVFTIGSPSTYLSAAYAIKPTGSTSFGAVQIAAAGTGPDNGFTMTPGFGGVGRWGDYSAGELNASTGKVWLATQYIPNNGDQFANWGNRIIQIQL